jgi:hypothetical protein
MDNLEFLDAGEPANEVVRPEAVEAVKEAALATTTAPPEIAAETPQETAEEKATRERDERGRFKAKDEKQPAPEGYVPVGVVQELREVIRTLKNPAPQTEQPQAQQVPDIFEDPEGFQNYQTQMVQRAIYSERLNISQRFATQQYGAETVQAAMEWGQAKCAADPAFNAAVMSNPDPVGYAVQTYQREQAFGKLGGDLKQIEAFLAWQQAQQAQPAAQSAPTQPVERPTSSIASATSAGGVQHTAVGPGVAFDNVIK